MHMRHTRNHGHAMNHSLAIGPHLLKNPISNLQEFAQQGKIFLPKYDDLTEKEGQPGRKFVCQVYTRSKAISNSGYNYNKLGYYSSPQFTQFKDYSAKGYGSSKRQAKANAAARLLSLVCGGQPPPPTYDELYGTSDSKSDKENDSPTCRKNPVSILHEYCQENVVDLKFTDKIDRGMFSCTVKIGSMETTGLGTSKKSAKSAAAAKMVNELEKIPEESEESEENLKPLVVDSTKTKTGKKKGGTKKNNKNKVQLQQNNDEKTPLFDFSSGKHSISLLQEFCQKRCLQLPLYQKKGIFVTQLANNRIQNFDMFATLTIGKKEYFSSGSGSTIKQAKAMSAANLIKQIQNYREEWTAELLGENKQTPEEKTEKTTQAKISELDPQCQMNALALVNQMFKPVIEIEEAPDKPDHRKEFIVNIKVEGKTYTGRGNSKKKAKLISAAACLEELAGHRQYDTVALEQTWSPEDFTTTELSFAKTVSNLVHQKYDVVCKGLQEHEIKRKVLAGILIRSSEKKDVNGNDDLQVLVVTTGTKCIDGSKLSSNGQALNDSHAEVLARRCFKRFLLEQVKRCHSKDSSILVKSKTPPFLLTTKPGLTFHLYISTSPCGDARIFNLSSPTSAQPQDSKVHGVLRSKIECGEGTIPITDINPLQTWDGVLAGERLRTMSCSDKLAMWNIVGAQGALLTHFMEPLYYDTLTIGACFNLYHSTRAVVTRVEGCQGLPEHYSVNKPLILPVAQQEQRIPSKSSGYSMNWILGEGAVEITRTNTGKCTDDKTSRLSKSSLFTKFDEACEAVTMSRPYLGKLYLDIKKDAKSYQTAKAKVVEVLKKKGYGDWVRKPIEQDMFSI